MKRDTGSDWARGLLRAIRRAVDSLPSDEETRAGIAAIDDLIVFLQKLRDQLEAQPSASRREDVERALVVLDSFLTATRGPVMLVAKPKRPKMPTNGTDVAAVRKELEALGLDEIRDRLQDTARYTTEDLRRLGRELRLRLDTRLPREDLADAILKRGFANPRTYEGLRGVQSITGSSEAK